MFNHQGGGCQIIEEESGEENSSDSDDSIKASKKI
jgi:hypothetical protein